MNTVGQGQGQSLPGQARALPSSLDILGKEKKQSHQPGETCDLSLSGPWATDGVLDWVRLTSLCLLVAFPFYALRADNFLYQPPVTHPVLFTCCPGVFSTVLNTGISKMNKYLFLSSPWTRDSRSLGCRERSRKVDSKARNID